MGYLEYQKEDLVNLNNSLNIEYLATNDSGSYACSTIINCNTRKYHGLLICPLPQLDGEKCVLLSALDEVIVDNDAVFNLGIHKYPTEFSPLGHKYATHFIADLIPTTTFRVGDVVLVKELLLVEKDERILIRYTLQSAPNEITLRLKPYLAFRKVHDLTHSNLSAHVRSKTADNGIISQLYDNYPDLYMQLNLENEFVAAPDWYYNIGYDKELERGYYHQEDLFVPGFFELNMKKGDSVVFSAGLSEIKSAGLKKKFTSELNKKIARDSYIGCLDKAAEQFIAKKGNRTEIIACYPWYGNWGRDSLISVPGLTLARNQIDVCKAVLDTISQDIDGALFSSIGNVDHANVSSLDTPLWYAWTVQQYLSASNDIETVGKKYYKKLQNIIDTYIESKSPDFSLNENGLIFITPSNRPLTWMDAEFEGNAIVSRCGFVVEINALWYNAVSFALELAEKTGDKKHVATYSGLKEKIHSAFSPVFWSDDHKYLADYVINDYRDFSVRPNQIFACSLPYSPINEFQQKDIVELIEKELLTPKGLRSLSPKSDKYRGSCSGSIYERAFAYHQGAVWPWLLGAFSESYLNLNGKAGLLKIKRLFVGMEDEMKVQGIGSISEIYDGNPPHTPSGSISQAWNVAELLRIKSLIEKTEI